MLLICPLLLSFHCRPSERIPVSVESIEEEQRPTHESWDVEFSVSEGVFKRIVITAEYLAEFTSADDSQYTVLQTLDLDTPVTARIFDERGEGTTLLTANEIRYFARGKIFVASGNVIVETDARTLETEKVVWNESDQSIRAPNFVRLLAENETIEGYDLRADEKLTDYEIARVTAQVIVEE